MPTNFQQLVGKVVQLDFDPEYVYLISGTQPFTAAGSDFTSKWASGPLGTMTIRTGYQVFDQ